MRRTIFVSACLFLAASGFAQTKAPAKKAAAAAMATVVPSGSEKWGDLPAAAMVGTPSVDMGGKIATGGRARESDGGGRALHAASFLHGRHENRSALASHNRKRDRGERHVRAGHGIEVGSRRAERSSLRRIRFRSSPHEAFCIVQGRLGRPGARSWSVPGQLGRSG